MEILDSLSPIPLPDPQAFEPRTFSTKRKIKKLICPSPPLKSPPVSRLFAPDSQIYTPHVRQINSHISPDSIPETPEQISPIYISPETKEPTFFESKFENLGQIGSGSFGVVFKVKDPATGKLYAIKKSRHQFRGLKDRERALCEVYANSIVENHPFILNYVNAWEEKGYLFIQMELCTKTLKEHLDQFNQPLEEEEVWNFILDLVLGLKHIHSLNLIHLDLKPSNIFLTEKGRSKIGDFGIAIFNGTWNGNHGDSCYMSPETLNGTPELVSFASDIFCLGAIAFEMALHIDLPPGGHLWLKLREGNISESFPPGFRSEMLKNFVCNLMDPEPTKRFTIDQILEHEKLKELIQQRELSGELNLKQLNTQKANTSNFQDIVSPLFSNIQSNIQLQDPFHLNDTVDDNEPQFSDLNLSLSFETENSTSQESSFLQRLETEEIPQFSLLETNRCETKQQEREKQRRESLESILKSHDTIFYPAPTTSINNSSFQEQFNFNPTPSNRKLSKNTNLKKANNNNNQKRQFFSSEEQIERKKLKFNDSNLNLDETIDWGNTSLDSNIKINLDSSLDASKKNLLAMFNNCN